MSCGDCRAEPKSGEALEPLGGGKYILQPLDGYRFGSDAVALAHFASTFIAGSDRVFDLCSGCGIVGLQTAIDTGASVTGAEIDGRLADMSARSAAIDGLSDTVRFFCADICAYKQMPEIFARGGFDAVVCNPPFFKADSKPASVAPGANSELTVTLGDVCETAAWLLRPRGTLCLVHTAARLDEVTEQCRRHRLMPKTLVLNANRKTFLLRCVKGGRQGMTVNIEEF